MVLVTGWTSAFLPRQIADIYSAHLPLTYAVITYMYITNP